MSEDYKTKEVILNRLHEIAGMKFHKGTVSTLPDTINVGDVLEAIDLDGKQAEKQE